MLKCNSVTLLYSTTKITCVIQPVSFPPAKISFMSLISVCLIKATGKIEMPEYRNFNKSALECLKKLFFFDCTNKQAKPNAEKLPDQILTQKCRNTENELDNLHCWFFKLCVCFVQYTNGPTKLY